SLGSSHPLADYYKTMFLFQQWFHSSYRARQGKVLEHLMRYALVKRARIDTIALPQDSRLRKFFQQLKTEPFQIATIKDMFQQLYPNQHIQGTLGDIDAFAVVDAGSCKRVIAIQIRSRDDTGGATAKGSLVDFLKKLSNFGVPQFDTLYLVGVWDKQSITQKKTTINKVLDALEIARKEGGQRERLVASETLGEGKRYQLMERIYLQLRYGLEDIQQAIDDWVNANSLASAPNLEDLTRDFICWDDFWIAYAIATIEIHNKSLTGKSNIVELVSLLENRSEICARLTHNPETIETIHRDIEQLAKDIVAIWNKPVHPFTTPRDIFLYIRDMLYLYAIYNDTKKTTISTYTEDSDGANWHRSAARFLG
ncbi:MAG: hypothetical protein P3X24_006215, partial [bacterium]|nr:hypothetical protein [bacterium]